MSSSRAYWLYNALVLMTSPLWLGVLVWRLVVQRKDRRGFRQRWYGLDQRAFNEATRGSPSTRQPHASRWPRIWLHAVSVGEVMAMAPLVRILRQRYPDALLVGSTVTDLGQDAMRTKLPDLDLVCYLPYDLWWSVRATIRTVSPSLFLFGETELWPNVLLSLRRAGILSVMVNGRISERSVRRYRWVNAVMRSVIRSIDALVVQSESDRERFMLLGADPARITVSGNMKADGAMSTPVRPDTVKILFGLKTEPLVVAGSTHEPEELWCAQSFISAHEEYPSLRLCIAPRHLERCDAIAAQLRGTGLVPLRRRDLPSSGRSWSDWREVIILDTIGELAECYACAAIVVMGGTFSPIGGHNLLEPAAAGVPILFGPHTGQWTAVASGLVDQGGAIRLQSEDHITAAFHGLLREPQRRQTMGEAAQDYVRGQQGATARTVAVIDSVMSATRDSATNGFSSQPLLDRRVGLASWGQWLHSDHRSARLSRRLLLPFSWCYGVVMQVRRWGYRHGWLTSTRLPVCVVSVGNLTVGGSGKTPLIIELAQAIQQSGRSVGIVLRGYRRVRGQDPLVVSDGLSVQSTTVEAGDEAMFLATRLPGVPVVVGTKRVDAGRLILEKCAPDIVLVDDGYQHLALERDVNVLLMDALLPPGSRSLLPSGLCRERISAVGAASAVVITDRRPRGSIDQDPAESGLWIRRTLQRVGYKGPVFVAHLEPVELIDLASQKSLALQVMTHTRVVACSAIGQPELFRQLLGSLGATVCAAWEFADHHRYTAHDFVEIARDAGRRGAAMVVTTEKDAVKFNDWPQPAIPVVAIRIALVVEPVRQWHEWLSEQLCKVPSTANHAAERRSMNGVHQPDELFVSHSHQPGAGSKP